MKLNLLILLLSLFQSIVFAQDKKVLKIAKYLEKGKGSEARELLDELDNIKTYQTDIYYWYVRTVYYRNIALDKPNTSNELAEARKSFEKLVELDKTDVEKSFTEYIPQFKKDLFEGKNKITKVESKSSSESVNQSNDGKTVTLTLIGQGKTKDAAKYNALRNALEKAFGAFISSNTTLLNDELIKDEIVSVSSGNIQNFEILSETQMPNGSYSSVVKATVSIVKLTSFCESKGIVVEFKGGLFAANIKLQELNKKNEEAVMANLFKILDKIVMKGFDFKIDVSDPKKDTYYDDKWIVNFSVTASGNKNLENIKDITMNILKNICLSPQEIIAYSNQNLSKYCVKINGRDYYFRSSFSTIYLRTIFEKKVPLASLNFSISDGLNKYECISLIKSNLQEGRTIHKKSDWPCLCNNCEDCGYVGSIKSNYKTNIYEFLGGVNPSNFQSISDSYSSYDSRFEIPNIDLEIFNSKEIVFAYDRNTFPIEIIYYFQKTYTMDQLSKITEYKVKPINK